MSLFLKLFVNPEFQKLLLQGLEAEGITEASRWYVHFHFVEIDGMKSIEYRTAKSNVNPFKFYYTH